MMSIDQGKIEFFSPAFAADRFQKGGSKIRIA